MAVPTVHQQSVPLPKARKCLETGRIEAKKASLGRGSGFAVVSYETACRKPVESKTALEGDWPHNLIAGGVQSSDMKKRDDWPSNFFNPAETVVNFIWQHILRITLNS
jgi:hypothetical protein